MKLNHEGQLGLMNLQGRSFPIVTRNQGWSQAISLAVSWRSELFLVHPLTEYINTPCERQLCMEGILLDCPPWAGLGFTTCPLYSAHLSKTKFKFTWYVNILKGKASFGAPLSSICSLVLTWAFFSFLLVYWAFWVVSFAEDLLREPGPSFWRKSLPITANLFWRIDDAQSF